MKKSEFLAVLSVAVVLLSGCVSSTTTGAIEREPTGDAAEYNYELGRNYLQNEKYELARDRLERALAHGGMGTVWEAQHMRLSSAVAVKVLRHKEGEGAAAQARFRREAMLGSQLRHRHMAQVFDYQHTERGFPYLVMELLQGEDLRARLRHNGDDYCAIHHPWLAGITKNY